MIYKNFDLIRQKNIRHFKISTQTPSKDTSDEIKLKKVKIESKFALSFVRHKNLKLKVQTHHLSRKSLSYISIYNKHGTNKACISIFSPTQPKHKNPHFMASHVFVILFPQ